MPVALLRCRSGSSSFGIVGTATRMTLYSRSPSDRGTNVTELLLSQGHSIAQIVRASVQRVVFFRLPIGSAVIRAATSDGGTCAADVSPVQHRSVERLSYHRQLYSDRSCIGRRIQRSDLSARMYRIECPSIGSIEDLRKISD